MKNKIDPYCPCPCCGELTITERGNWEICANCGWEDDPVQSENENYVGGANKISLLMAKEKLEYLKLKATKTD
jgi:hypothetical protein